MTDDVLDLDIHGLAIEVWPDVERVVRMLFPVDSDPDGEWLLTVPHPLAGDDYEITGVADTFGDPERPRVSFTLPADRMRDVMRQRFVISLDGVPKLSGPLRVASPQAMAGETTVSITLVEPQALDVDLTVIGGVTPGDTAHTVAAFADDFDPTGSFTTVPLLPGGDTPRAYLTGATVLVVGGDHLGLWTIPASGPATAGAALAPGDVIASQTGRVAVAQTTDGSTVSGVLLQADLPYVDAIETGLAGDIDDLSNAIDAEADARETGDTTNASTITAAVARTRLIAQAERTTSPTAYARCGTDSDANFQSAWAVASPTTRLDILTWVRVVDAREPGFYETIAESLDGLGDRYRYEKAKWNNDGEVTEYAEGTRAGDTIEYHREGDGHTQIDGSASSGPSLDGVWVRSMSTYYFAQHRIVNVVEDDVFWDFELYGHRWRTVDVYDNPIIDSLAASAGHNTWIGRGQGEFHIARIRMWADSVEVMDFDPSTGANDDTSVTDSVAEIEGSPVVWEGTSPNDKVVVPSTGGGVELGETSTTAYRGDRGKTAYDHSQLTSGNPHGVTAADVGAAPTSRTITAGTGLTGGGSLASDRTLAVVYGTSAGTAAQGNDARLSDARTPTDASVTLAKLAAATLSRIGATVEATSDSTARTLTTYTADGVLQFEGAADTTYRIDAYLIFQGDATADLKVGFSTPAGTMHLTVEGALTTVASGADYDRFLTLTSSGQTTVVGIAGASTPIAVRISGVIHLTSAGTVSFGWAPNAAGAGTGVTRLARSQLYYRAV